MSVLVDADLQFITSGAMNSIVPWNILFNFKIEIMMMMMLMMMMRMMRMMMMIRTYRKPAQLNAILLADLQSLAKVNYLDVVFLLKVKVNKLIIAVMMNMMTMKACPKSIILMSSFCWKWKWKGEYLLNLWKVKTKNEKCQKKWTIKVKGKSKSWKPKKKVKALENLSGK